VEKDNAFELYGCPIKHKFLQCTLKRPALKAHVCCLIFFVVPLYPNIKVQFNASSKKPICRVILATRPDPAALNPRSLPLFSDVHGICVTLTEKLLENEAPLVTAVSTTGELDERPMSTYTAKSPTLRQHVIASERMRNVSQVKINGTAD
jgi:hypothetical protein